MHRRSQAQLKEIVRGESFAQGFSAGINSPEMLRAIERNPLRWIQEQLQLGSDAASFSPQKTAGLIVAALSRSADRGGLADRMLKDIAIAREHPAMDGVKQRVLNLWSVILTQPEMSMNEAVSVHGRLPPIIKADPPAETMTPVTQPLVPPPVPELADLVHPRSVNAPSASLGRTTASTRGAAVPPDSTVANVVRSQGASPEAVPGSNGPASESTTRVLAGRYPSKGGGLGKMRHKTPPKRVPPAGPTLFESSGD